MRRMDEKLLITVFTVVLLVFSANLEGVESQGVSCYDSCSTGCVNPDIRLMQRCERKCQIRCSPGLEASKN